MMTSSEVPFSALLSTPNPKSTWLGFIRLLGVLNVMLAYMSSCIRPVRLPLDQHILCNDCCENMYYG